jgi:hypothetical protein
MPFFVARRIWLSFIRDLFLNEKIKYLNRYLFHISFSLDGRRQDEGEHSKYPDNRIKRLSSPVFILVLKGASPY